ncbi:MAG: hypothetical protein MUD12_04790 [Spirochaetes bacterium]|jgi:alpha-N-arabinofuranosidase|nr:hypothetical protein [Spirochaetota bacterium]
MKLGHVFYLLVLVQFGFQLSGCTECSGATQPKTGIMIKVDAKSVSHTVSPMIFGTNLQWEKDGDGIIKKVHDDGNTVEYNSEVMERMKDLRVAMLRFPGGSLADKYVWEHGIGGLNKRGMNPGFDDKMMKSNLGLDEFVTICRTMKYEPMYTVNFNTKPDNARDLVEYCNSTNTKKASLRKENGYKKPHGIRYWEIGNEIYSTLEKGHTTPEEYSRKYIEFYKKMKQADPKILVGAIYEVTFQKAPWVKNSQYAYLLKWNEAVASRISKYTDFASIHFYCPFDYKFSESDLNDIIMASPKMFIEACVDLNRMLDKKTKLFVTEYNIFFTPSQFKKVSSAGGAMFIGSMLMEFAKNNIGGACQWSLLNNTYFGMIRSDKSIILRPSYHVFKMLRNHCGKYVVKSESNSPTFNCKAFGNMPEKNNVPLVETLATMDENKKILYVVVQNKSLERSFDAKISINNAGFKDDVNVAEVSSREIFDDNEDGVKITPRNFKIKANKTIDFVSKPCSITAFKINLASAR